MRFLRIFGLVGREEQPEYEDTKMQTRKHVFVDLL